jgi:hypothetical protein
MLDDHTVVKAEAVQLTLTAKLIQSTLELTLPIHIFIDNQATIILSYPRFSQVQLHPSKPTLARSGLVCNSKTLELGYASTLVLSICSYYLSPNVLVLPPCIIRASAPPSGTFVPGALLPIRPPQLLRQYINCMLQSSVL